MKQKQEKTSQPSFNSSPVDEFRNMIIEALRRERKYSPSLDIQVLALASALCALTAANNEISGLDSVTVLEETRYGQKLAPHPAFKVQRDAMDSVTRQMKQLSLTVEDLSMGDDADPLVELTQKVIDASTHKTVRPRK